MGHLTKPFIGINADFLPAGKQHSAQVRIHPGYVDSVLAAGGLPVVIAPMSKEVEIDAYLDRLDGFILSGGKDIDPRRVGLPTHHAVQPMAERRDDFDRYLLRRLLARQMPLLAVGVGMQQLNVALGGTLILHLPEEMPRSMPHRDPTGGPHRHLILLEPNTHLSEIYGGGEIRINSSHHQAVRQVGEGLRVAAVAPDGVIEAIETTDPNWFCIGIQWHPESETASALDMQLFECFIQACLRQVETLPLAA
jgi:putative glutamine amidotransferase